MPTSRKKPIGRMFGPEQQAREAGMEAQSADAHWYITLGEEAYHKAFPGDPGWSHKWAMEAVSVKGDITRANLIAARAWGNRKGLTFGPGTYRLYMSYRWEQDQKKKLVQQTVSSEVEELTKRVAKSMEARDIKAEAKKWWSKLPGADKRAYMEKFNKANGKFRLSEQTVAVMAYQEEMGSSINKRAPGTQGARQGGGDSPKNAN